LPPGRGFTADELRQLASELTMTDADLAQGILSAIRKALRGQRINPRTSKLLTLAGEIELALNDRKAEREMMPRPRRRK
jgi:hypothetical protein